MAGTAVHSEYDSFAWIYNRYMGEDFGRRALPAVERLFLSELPERSHVLDLCCGTGNMARMLSRRGYRVTGLDSSEMMLHFARQNAPTCEFLLADAQQFSGTGTFVGALSTFNSLAHVETVSDLAAVFRNVQASLLSGGLFLFDLSMEEAYASRWRGSFTMMAEDHVCVVRLSYAPEQKIGRNDVTAFRLDTGHAGYDSWRRCDYSILQKCHSEADLRSALAAAQFSDVQVFDAQYDLGMDGEHGRSFFLARKT